ncbi:uncharacterized protein I303_106829 [Kwoniella dejecticola CBS 10117]|uniref:Uncharacterized protein n=1 Tax=Kwoniella dejecticola CBS 10117 TaxID=1296121 RepID=A0AAJ8MJ89_9TREE
MPSNDDSKNSTSQTNYDTSTGSDGGSNGRPATSLHQGNWPPLTSLGESGTGASAAWQSYTEGERSYGGFDYDNRANDPSVGDRCN